MSEDNLPKIFSDDKTRWVANAITAFVFITLMVVTGVDAWVKTGEESKVVDTINTYPTPAYYNNSTNPNIKPNSTIVPTSYYDQRFPSPTMGNYSISPTPIVTQTQNDTKGSVYCTDSDATVSPEEEFVKGYVTIQDSNGLINTTYDYCSNDKWVSDMRCQNIGGSYGYVVESVSIDCPNGCFDGACKR